MREWLKHGLIGWVYLVSYNNNDDTIFRCAAEWQTKRIQEEQKRKKVEVELHGLISGKADLIAQCDDLKNLLAKERQSSNSLNKELSVAAERQNELLKCIKTLENKVQQQKKVYMT